MGEGGATLILIGGEVAHATSVGARQEMDVGEIGRRRILVNRRWGRRGVRPAAALFLGLGLVLGTRLLLGGALPKT